MEYIFALILSAFFTVVFIYLKKNKTNFVKPKAVKKEELIENYKVELQEILEKYEDNKELQLQERLKFLKRVNYELSMNIFFEKDEARNLIQELSNLGK
jgi:membrane protein insertase Oxa1/YidC/SpoIIIJ